jgi:hypothetical protein
VVVSVTSLVFLHLASLPLQAGPLISDGPDSLTFEFGFFAPMMILGKVYSNAMMANLNHHIRIYNGQDDPQMTSFVEPPGSFFVSDVETQENAGGI